MARKSRTKSKLICKQTSDQSRIQRIDLLDPQNGDCCNIPMTVQRWKSAIALSVVVIGYAPTAAADTPQAAGGASWQANADKMAEARRRYDLGLKLYEDGNYEASRIEFERAMSLAPSYRILFNIGQAYKQLNNYVAAVSAFERYLVEGGSEVPEERKTQVKTDITELQRRIGRIRISTTPGAEITIDGVVVGKAPLSGPIPINPGLRRFGAQAAGYLPTTKTVTVGSSDNPEIVLNLEPLPKATIVERRSNPWVVPAIVGWSVTGVAAITTGIVGGLSLSAKSDQKDLLAQNGATPDQLTAARDKTQTLSGVTDVALVTTAIGAGVSIFFTYKLVRSGGKTGPEAPAASLTFVPGPGSFSALGTF